MKNLPVVALAIAVVLVAVSVVAPFHGVGTSNGTILFAAVGSVALRLVSKVALPTYSHQHHVLALSVAIVLNIFLFLIPAVPAFLALRKHRPVASSCISAIWCAFYIACLLVLFPLPGRS